MGRRDVEPLASGQTPSETPFDGGYREPMRWYLAVWVAIGLGCSTAAEPRAQPRAQPRTERAPAVVAEPESASQPAPAPAPVDDAPDSLTSLPDRAAWARLAARSDEHAIARTEVVKILWDHATDTLYYCQSGRWPIHYDFAVRFLQTDARPLGDRRAFNARQYLRADREMQMASVVHYRDADLWVVELGPADTLDGSGVVALVDRIRRSSFLDRELAYRPRSEEQRLRIERSSDRLRVIDPNTVWEGVRYQPVTLGETVGRLRLVRDRLDTASVLPDEVLVLAHVPNDLPVCAGVITAEVQAPLAHVAVLSQSRGTPNMALRGAMTDARLSSLDDQLVRLVVGSDDFTIDAATGEEMVDSREARRPAPVSTPTLDRSRAALVDTCSLRLGDASWAGAKAAQLGEVCSLGVETSGGFVIPVARYLQHLERHAIDARAATLRATPSFEGDGHARARALEELRNRISTNEVDASLVSEVARRVRSVRGRRWIFRSSTNAEDLPGFSGAGLYESVVTGRDPDEAAIARAIAEVWASVYSRRGWDEREHYGVDHDAVAMAILAQPFVADVAAMGVAITENPFSTRRSGILVNLAPPGASVTAAEGDDLPEQILLYRHSRPEVISRSTRHPGPLLAPEAMRPLRDLLDRVHTHMMARWGADRADAADVELALRRDGRAVILQARPYRMRRGPG